MKKMVDLRKEDFKHLGLSLAYDFVLVALVVCWALAIAFAILESAYWLVILFFVLGTGFFLMTIFLFKEEEAEDAEEDEESEEPAKEIEE